MAGDPGYRRFFALIGLFVFSMTGLVLSNNYVLTYVSGRAWAFAAICWSGSGTRARGRRGRDEGIFG